MKPQTQNGYAYTSGDPVNYADPTGKLFKELISIGAAIAIHSNVEQQAENFANGNQQSLIDEPADAYRHSEWMKQTAAIGNPQGAVIAGALHEIFSPWNDPAVKARDMYNNVVAAFSLIPTETLLKNNALIYKNSNGCSMGGPYR